MTVLDRPAEPESPRFTEAMRMLAGLLEQRTGQILSEARIWRIETALKPLLRSEGLDSLEGLVGRIAGEGSHDLIDQVVNALLNNESSFFRDLQIFNVVGGELLPRLRETAAKRQLRIWCAGCSTGQEAYSLAILLRREWALWKDWRIQILATDISGHVIQRARSGLFSQIDVQRGLAIGDLMKWFDPVGDEWRIADELRTMIDFRVDNVFDARMPTGAYDLILCRNVLLYFSPDMRRKAFDLLSRHSREGSVLLLGAGETAMGLTDNFVASSTFRGCYERRENETSPLRKRVSA